MEGLINFRLIDKYIDESWYPQGTKFDIYNQNKNDVKRIEQNLHD